MATERRPATWPRKGGILTSSYERSVHTSSAPRSSLKMNWRSGVPLRAGATRGATRREVGRAYVGGATLRATAARYREARKWRGGGCVHIPSPDGEVAALARGHLLLGQEALVHQPGEHVAVLDREIVVRAENVGRDH